MNSIWIEFHARPIDTFSINCRAYKNVEIYTYSYELNKTRCATLSSFPLQLAVRAWTVAANGTAVARPSLR